MWLPGDLLFSDYKYWDPSALKVAQEAARPCVQFHEFSLQGQVRAQSARFLGLLFSPSTLLASENLPPPPPHLALVRNLTSASSALMRWHALAQVLECECSPYRTSSFSTDAVLGEAIFGIPGKAHLCWSTLGGAGGYGWQEANEDVGSCCQWEQRRLL